MSDCILVTGATGKVGRRFIETILADPARSDVTIKALCHNRVLEETERVQVVRGSISDRTVVADALVGVTHVVHLATCKEIPEDVMDVTVKGLFWLLEEARVSDTFQRFLLVGGDAGMGHFVYPHPVPVHEEQRWSPYPGCYALSKVLEECMLEQYYTQYDFDGCCVRAPWIMEKDDFKYSMSFGTDQFGGPSLREIVGFAQADAYAANGTVPVLSDETGTPIQRNFVHVDDLVDAMAKALWHPQARQQLFNVCMDEPVDYGAVAAYLSDTRGLPSVVVKTPYHSTWLDNTKAKFLLGWRPQVDLPSLIDRAYDFERASDDPRKIWYPG